MLTSLEIKQLRLLHRSHNSKKAGLFIAEGEKIVRAFLEGGLRSRSLYTTDEKIANRLVEYGCIRISGKQMSQISAMPTPSSILGVFPIPAHNAHPLRKRITLALDGIQDPGNVGGILRTADWFGHPQILCTPDCASLYSPKGIHASMGAIAQVHAVYTDLVALVKELPRGFPVLAASMDGEPYQECETVTEGVIILGSEGRGIRPELLELATHRIAIPKGSLTHMPVADSLNVAATAAILCAHFANERGLRRSNTK